MRSVRRSKTKIQDYSENEEKEIYLSSEIPVATVLCEEPIALSGNTNGKYGEKCGEIYRNKDENLNYLCTICCTLFKSIEKFAIHLKFDHYDFNNKKDIENSLKEPQIKIEPDFHKEKYLQNSDILNDALTTVLEENKKKVSVKNVKNVIIKKKTKKSSKKKYIRRVYPRKYNRVYVLCKLCNKRFTSQLYLDSHLNFDHVAMPHLPGQGTDNQQHDSTSDADDGLDETEKEKRKEIRQQKKEEEKKLLVEKLHESIAQDPLKCRYCDQRFRGRMNRFEHECLHTGEKHFKCNECQSSFRKKCSLKSHMLIHQNIKPYDCELCDQKFRSIQHLRVHVFQHKGLKPYKCKYCGKGFTQTSGRKTHERIHTKEKPYQCTQCGVRFVTGSSLNKHNRIHANIKAYKCSFCGKSFVVNSDLKVHEKIHVGEGSNVCKICDARFLTLRGLKIHMNGHTKSGIQVTDSDMMVLPKTIPNEASTSTSQASETPVNAVQNDKKNPSSSLSSTSNGTNENKNSVLPEPVNVPLPNAFGTFGIPSISNSTYL